MRSNRFRSLSSVILYEFLFDYGITSSILIIVATRVFTIFLTLAVAFAVGVCPCGRERLAQKLLGMSASTERSNIVQQACCPICHKENSRQDSDGNRPHLDRCAQMVSGEMPSQYVTAPAPDLSLNVFLSFNPLVAVAPNFADRPVSIPLWFPPPPTLIDLSCCLTV